MNPQQAQAWPPTIDWSRPWLALYRDVGRRVMLSLQAGRPVAAALQAELSSRPGIALAAGPLAFVAQDALVPGEAYEAFIARTACVPTRDNLHDLFNGLVWLVHPSLKRRLNALQAEELARVGVGATRGSLRDALTLFDENAALLQAPDVLVSALRRHDWHTAFVAQREAWRDAQVCLFGHALLEKLERPRSSITAHAWVVAGAVDDGEVVVSGLMPLALAAKPFLTLPVLGVPGWWAPNEAPDFYGDTRVFRPPQAQKKTAAWKPLS